MTKIEKQKTVTQKNREGDPLCPACGAVMIEGSTWFDWAAAERSAPPEEVIGEECLVCEPCYHGDTSHNPNNAHYILQDKEREALEVI